MYMKDDKKMQLKDLITLGVLNAVFIAIFSIIAMIVGMLPVTGIFTTAVAAVPLGVVFMLLMAKVTKKGVFLISGILQGAIFLLMGVYWPLSIAIVITAIIAEIIVQGAHKNLKRIITGYAVLICGYSLGSFVPLVFFSDAYRVMADSRGYDAGYINKIIELLTGPVLLGVVIVSIAGALLGAFLGMRILKKHFIRAGIV